MSLSSFLFTFTSRILFLFADSVAHKVISLNCILFYFKIGTKIAVYWFSLLKKTSLFQPNIKKKIYVLSSLFTIFQVLKGQIIWCFFFTKKKKTLISKGGFDYFFFICVLRKNLY